MIEPMNDPDLSNRPFSYYHLSGKKFLKWVESKDYELPPTNPPLSNEVQFQVEWFLAEMMRSISKNLTGEKILKQAKVILQKDDEKILEDLNPLGKFFLGSLKHDGGFPENRAPLAEFFLGSQRSTYWRNLISDAVYLGELTLLDYPTLKPITEKQKNKVLGRIFEPVATADTNTNEQEASADDQMAGQRATDADAGNTKTKPNNRGSKVVWTNERVEEAINMRDRLKAIGVTGPTKQTALHYGVTNSRLNKVFSEHRKRKAKPTSPAFSALDKK